MKSITQLASLASVALLTTSCQENPQKTETTELPNIIFIVSEDNSPFLGCYGDDQAHTPNIDNFAAQGILYENAFSVAPVCAPSRSSLITGMYASSLGSHQMRSKVAIPEEFHFFPYYLRQAGYYTVNRQKKDYNIIDQDDVWDDDQWWEYENMLKNRQDSQPFFAMFNTFMSHESKIHGEREDDMLPYFRSAAIESMTGTPASEERTNKFNFLHDPDNMDIPPYHPELETIKEDWARYYDCVSMMDDEVGELLKNLEQDGLLENTIVFYFSDHGGVLGRSKRFTFESGLRIPMIVRVPEKYSHITEMQPGSRTDRLVALIDLAPTVLNLVGLDIPEHFQGYPFLGEESDSEQRYTFGFRGRMDERYDFSRTARSKDFRYIRNYMPHRPWGQRVNYLWRAKNIQAWEDAYLSGETNEAQSRFWESKPVEELYDIHNDPHNVHNLAGDPQYSETLQEMREATAVWMTMINDKNFIPEGEFLAPLEDTTAFEYYYNNSQYDFENIKMTADRVIYGDTGNLDFIEESLLSNDPVIRYWGAVGCCILKEQAEPLKPVLKEKLNDPSLDVRIAAAEALYFMGEKGMAKNTLREILQSDKYEKYGYWEAIRTHALNVVTLMDENDISDLSSEIIQLSRADFGYDSRIAEYLLEEKLP